MAEFDEPASSSPPWEWAEEEKLGTPLWLASSDGETLNGQQVVDHGAPLPLQYFDEIAMKLEGLWLVKHLLPSTGLAVLYGHPGSGKSFLALDWALHVALGWEWQGRKTASGLVIYIGAEGLTGLRNRIAAFRQHHRVAGLPFALIPCPIDMQAPQGDISRLIETIRAVEEHFQTKATFIPIDTISKTFGAGKENTDDMVSYVANCQRVANEFECLVMPVHHRPKDTESEEPRGHSSLKGGAETIIIVEAGETKKARVIKQKDGDDGIECLFRLRVVELGEDEDGEPVTSCICEPVDRDTVPRGNAPAAKAARLPDGAKLALQQLDETLEQAGIAVPAAIPDTEVNRNIVGKVALFEDWREKAEKQGRDIDWDTLRKAFYRAKTRLQKDGLIRTWEEYVWRTWK